MESRCSRTRQPAHPLRLPQLRPRATEVPSSDAFDSEATGARAVISGLQIAVRDLVRELHSNGAYELLQLLGVIASTQAAPTPWTS